MYGQADGQADGLMDGWTDGWIDKTDARSTHRWLDGGVGNIYLTPQNI